jgi:nitrile hydratase alpha subunit
MKYERNLYAFSTPRCAVIGTYQRGPGPGEVEAKLVARAWADESYRDRLKADPRAAVAEETGVTVPESVAIEVLEETPDKAYLVIPSNRMAIADEDLNAAGGADWGGS